MDFYGFFFIADILENFDNHPPLILPSSTFHLELSKPITDPALFEQLSHLQDFISRLPHSETQVKAEEQVTSSLSASGNDASASVSALTSCRLKLRFLKVRAVTVLQ